MEVGTGFHPELTGRENVYLNGTILGMKKKEVDKKLDEIVEFSGVKKFIKHLVKRYSSGMKVRLAFSVAAHLEPEILIVDEVLAVGDVAFQHKCLEKMENISKVGRTVLFVSHNMSAIQNLCSRAILLQSGRNIRDGTCEEVIQYYLSTITNNPENPFLGNVKRKGNGLVQLTAAKLLDDSNKLSQHVIAGRSIFIEFDYKNTSQEKQANVAMTIYNHLGIPVTHLGMTLTNFMINELGTEGSFRCAVPSLPFPIGHYWIAVSVTVKGQVSDSIANVLSFEVVSSQFYSSPQVPAMRYCTCMIEHEWQHTVKKPNMNERL